jgi:hypothetical protein
MRLQAYKNTFMQFSDVTNLDNDKCEAVTGKIEK